MYIYGTNNLIFMNKPRNSLVLMMLILLAISLAIMTLQKICGPRFMIPLALRRMPNPYIKRLNHEIEEAEECAICMNKIIHEVVDDDNEVSSTNVEIEMQPIPSEASSEAEEEP